MNILNMVFGIVIYFCACFTLKSLFRLKLEHDKLHVIQTDAPMTSNSFRQDIADMSQFFNVIQLIACAF